MAIKLDGGIGGDIGFGLVRMQPQNADLKPQSESNVPGLADPNSVRDGNLPMDPIPDFASRSVEATPFRNLRNK